MDQRVKESSLDPVTLENKLLTVMPQCSHLMSNHDGTLITDPPSRSPGGN